MNLTIREQIRANILTSLGNVSTANVDPISGNHFATTLSVQSRLPQEGNPITNYLCVVGQGVSHRLQKYPVGKVDRQVTFDIIVYLFVDKAATNPPDYLLNQIWGDVHNALMYDAQRSTLALDTFVEDSVPIESINPGDYEGILITAAVSERTLYLDATNK